jgi:hypothetical protein
VTSLGDIEVAGELLDTGVAQFGLDDSESVQRESRVLEGQVCPSAF